jgi:hypothetical protein
MLAVLRFFLWAGFAFIEFCIFVAAATGGRHREQTDTNILWGLFALGLVILWWLRNWILTGSSKKDISDRTKVLEDFQTQKNFTIDQVLIGSLTILFDTKARRMAFYEDDIITEHPLDYIRSWEQRWTYRGEKTYNHRFHVLLNDLNRPRITVTPGSGWSAGNRANADQWDATLDLILIGGATR